MGKLEREIDTLKSRIGLVEAEVAKLRSEGKEEAKEDAPPVAKRGRKPKTEETE